MVTSTYLKPSYLNSKNDKKSIDIPLFNANVLKC